MKKTAIYTRRGDSGTTSLVNGARVPKCNMRVEAYGTIDELNAHLGALVAVMGTHPQREFVEGVMNNLFNVGCYLAGENKFGIPAPHVISSIEEQIDKISEELPVQQGFLLPPTDEAAARANVCRTVCRRAERCIVALSLDEKISEETVAYVNRLSDYLFLLSRLLGNNTEKMWEKHWK